MHAAKRPIMCAGWVAFILKLKKGYYLYQFGQFAWTHLILLFVFVPSSFFVANIFDGIIWFLLPCSLVIINDIGAYLAGLHLSARCLLVCSPVCSWPCTSAWRPEHWVFGTRSRSASAVVSEHRIGCARSWLTGIHGQGR